MTDGRTEPEDPWGAAWPGALGAWSALTMLREPRYLHDEPEIQRDQMSGEIACIRLSDHVIFVNRIEVAARGLDAHALPILAHEIGHHVYVPGTLRDHARMISAMSHALGGLPERCVHVTANIYADLLVNDRLQRRAGLDMAGVYDALVARSEGGASKVWTVMCCAYEHLWRLTPGRLTRCEVDATTNADGMLLARIVRSFAREWLPGAPRFATVLYPYLAADASNDVRQVFELSGMHDTRRAAASEPGRTGKGIPDGIAAMDAWEVEAEAGEATRAGARVADEEQARGHAGQYREPFEYGALLSSLGLRVEEDVWRARYYRERALPHLLPFPTRRRPRSAEPIAEGEAPWQPGDALESWDVLASVLHSPRLVPGVTTVQTVYGSSEGSEAATEPVDLDIYVDCSGSMPNPAVNTSYLALAGTILALSALRAGARVQATLWSGPGQFDSTKGFIRDEALILRVVTGYLCGSTAFPLHILRDTYETRGAAERPVHIVVISDDGADTMLAKDEKGQDGAEVCERALRVAAGGGTLLLNLALGGRWRARAPLEAVGFEIHAVNSWRDFVAFSRSFVRRVYAPGSPIVTAGRLQ